MVQCFYMYPFIFDAVKCSLDQFILIISLCIKGAHLNAQELSKMSVRKFNMILRNGFVGLILLWKICAKNLFEACHSAYYVLTFLQISSIALNFYESSSSTDAHDCFSVHVCFIVHLAVPNCHFHFTKQCYI